MICPKCGAENPAGRGFCVKCANPLPDERPHQNAVEPITFDSDLEPVRKRRVGLGIASLVMGILGAISSFFLSSFFSADLELVRQTVEKIMQEQGIDLSAYNIDTMNLIGMVMLVYAFFCLLFGLLGAIFGGVGYGKLQKNQKLYTGKGVCITGLILSLIALVLGAVGVVHAVGML